MACDELILKCRVVPLSDDDLDAACEAAANGLRALVIEECDEPNDEDGTIVMRFRVSPQEPT